MMRIAVFYIKSGFQVPEDVTKMELADGMIRMEVVEAADELEALLNVPSRKGYILMNTHKVGA